MKKLILNRGMLVLLLLAALGLSVAVGGGIAVEPTAADAPQSMAAACGSDGSCCRGQADACRQACAECPCREDGQCCLSAGECAKECSCACCSVRAEGSRKDGCGPDNGREGCRRGRPKACR